MTPTTYALTKDIDESNAKLYHRFPYPWPPACFDRPEDPDIWRRLVCQEIGDWEGRRIPRGARIWVVGCGTNQALFTALRFPDAMVLGTDVSDESLSVCRARMPQLDITNLELRRESVNDADYDREFDMIICTGVVDHVYDPEFALGKVARALKLDGLLELMVNSAQYRAPFEAVKTAIDRLTRVTGRETSLDERLDLARKILASHSAERFPIEHVVQTLTEAPDEAVADALLKPLERSFSLPELAELVRRCGLELIAPVNTPFDEMRDALPWYPRFADRELAERTRRMSDLDRWTLVQALGQSRAPLLWFYLENASARTTPRSAADINEDFLAAEVQVVRSSRIAYLLQPDGSYRLAGTGPLRPRPRNLLVHRLLDEVAGGGTVGDALDRMGADRSSADVDALRVATSVPRAPYLVTAQ